MDSYPSGKSGIFCGWCFGTGCLPSTYHLFPYCPKTVAVWSFFLKHFRVEEEIVPGPRQDVELEPNRIAIPTRIGGLEDPTIPHLVVYLDNQECSHL